jgi:hypothetical protein
MSGWPEITPDMIGEADAPIYEDTRQSGFDPQAAVKSHPPTKAERRRAGRLTGKVWAAICKDLNADTFNIELTGEIPCVQ